jgi:prepilin-type N-terminal cleavage/methylation domain-containing protein
MIKPVDNANGFTLLELILSLVIIGFIVGISLGAIRLGIATQETGTKRAETFQRLRIIGEHLSEKIKSSYPVFIPPSQVYDPKSPSQRILAFEGKKDSIRFVTFATPISSPDKAVWAHEVKFYLGKHPQSGETGIIMMEKDIADGEIFSSSRSTKDNGRYFLLAKNVDHLNFRYYQLEKQDAIEPGATKEPLVYTGKWVDKIEFHSEPQAVSPDKNLAAKESPLTLPKGVEISLGLMEPAASGKKKDSKLFTSPPILLLLHSGMEFKLPPEETDEKTS